MSKITLIEQANSPDTPATGEVSVYVSQSTKKLATKDDAGAVVDYGAAAGPHASTHTNGTDDIQDATASQKGLMTVAQAKAAAVVVHGTKDQWVPLLHNGTTTASFNNGLMARKFSNALDEEDRNAVDNLPGYTAGNVSVIVYYSITNSGDPGDVIRLHADYAFLKVGTAFPANYDGTDTINHDINGKLWDTLHSVTFTIPSGSIDLTADTLHLRIRREGTHASDTYIDGNGFYMHAIRLQYQGWDLARRPTAP